MIFTEKQKARYDKFIHNGGDHGSDGELWNRHDLHIIIHGLLKKRLRRAPDAAWRCSKCKRANNPNQCWECGHPRSRRR